VLKTLEICSTVQPQLQPHPNTRNDISNFRQSEQYWQRCGEPLHLGTLGPQERSVMVHGDSGTPEPSVMELCEACGFLRPGRAEQDKNRQKISFPREGGGFVQIRILLLEARLRGFQARGRKAPNAGPRASLPQNNADLMLPTVVDERNDWGIGQRLAVHFNQNDTA